MLPLSAVHRKTGPGELLHGPLTLKSLSGVTKVPLKNGHGLLAMSEDTPDHFQDSLTLRILQWDENVRL